MLDKPQFDGGFSLLERGFSSILSRNHLAGLRGGGHKRLPLGWRALLQLTKAANPTEQAIQLINRDGLFEFWAGAVEQLLSLQVLTIAETAESA